MTVVARILLQALPAPSPSPTPAFGTNLISVAFFCSTMIWGPAIVAAVIAVLPNPRGRYNDAFRWIALVPTAFLLVVNLIVYSNFQTFGTALQFEEKYAWLPALGVSYHLGLDGLGMAVLVLSSFIGSAAVVASWNVRTRVRAYFALLLLLQAAINGVIVSQDAFLFALFMTATILPAGLLLLGWGGPNRMRASARLIGYWGVGAVALWFGVLLLYGSTGGVGFDLAVLLRATPPLAAQITACVALLIAACCWLPIVPFHGWARDALAEAPPGVAVLLVGATRLGGYLLLRIVISGEHNAAVKLGSTMAGLAAATALYAGVLAIAEIRARGDLRRAAATIALVPGAVTLLAVAGETPMAFDGAIFTLYAGGLAAALLVGAFATLAERAETRSLAVLGGVGLRAPILFWIAILGALAVLGFPGFASYLVGIMTVIGSIRNEPGGTFGVLAGLILAAGAVAALLWRVGFAPPTGERALATETDIPQRLYLSGLVVALIWVGVLPSGPKVAGVPIFDPGFVNVMNATTSTQADAYSVPVKP